MLEPVLLFQEFHQMLQRTNGVVEESNPPKDNNLNICRLAVSKGWSAVENGTHNISWSLMEKPTKAFGLQFQFTLVALFWSFEGMAVWPASNLSEALVIVPAVRLSEEHVFLTSAASWWNAAEQKRLEETLPLPSECGYKQVLQLNRIRWRMPRRHLRPSSLQRLYTRCLGWRLRRNLWTWHGSKPLPPRLSKLNVDSWILSGISR